MPTYLIVAYAALFLLTVASQHLKNTGFALILVICWFFLIRKVRDVVRQKKLEAAKVGKGRSEGS